MSDSTLILPDDLEPTERGVLKGAGQGDLGYVRWDHEAPKGRVVILHGYGEYGERYSHTAFWLHAAGWSVSAMDQRGFGRSGGARGDADGIRAFVDDFVHFLRMERHRDALRAAAPPRIVEGVPMPPSPVMPLIVLGHSFGGLVSLLTALWHPDVLEGLILSSPAVGLRRLSLVERILQGVLSRTAPHFRLHWASDKTRVCSDPVLVQRYWADPLCHQMITPAFVMALEEGRRELLPFGAEMDRPILLLEAGEDTLVDPDRSDALWTAMRPGLLERHRLHGYRHEVFHDRRRREIEALSEAWLEIRVRDWRQARPGIPEVAVAHA